MKQSVRMVAAGALVMISLVVCEAALWVADRSSRTVHGLLLPVDARNARTLPGADGMRRGNPYRPDHDEAGYRNPSRPDHADLVVLGDSQAYGAGIPPESAWPARLGAYNMALPSYGPGHNLLQIDEALALHPRTLIVSVYFGNDFADTFWLSSQRPQLVSEIDPELRLQAEEAERLRPIMADVPSLLRGRTDPPGPLARAGAWAADRVKILGLLRAAWTVIVPPAMNPLLTRNFESAVAALPEEGRAHTVFVDQDGWRTILTPDYRGRVQEPDDPRIRLGFEASVNSLKSIRRRAEAANVSLLVVLIPTKESVFWPRAPSNGPLRRLVTHEAEFRRSLIDTLRAEQIPFVDTLPVLRAAADQPYFEDVDGHPNEQGHLQIAEAVLAYLESAPP